MPKVWLPISYGGRTRNILIPYSHNIDNSHLDEIIEWQKEKTLAELKKLPPKPKRIISKKEVGCMLNDYLGHLKRKKTGERKYF